MFDQNIEEHYIKRNNSSKPTYYIIRRMAKETGLLTRYRMIMGHIVYALNRGWLPVVDMQNYPNPYLAPDKLGKENAWEYYFEQPLRIGLEQAYNGDNVILSNGDRVDPYPGHAMSFLENRNNALTEWRMLIKLGLLKIKPALHDEILATREKLFKPNERVLGVHLRGTDYFYRAVKHRPIPPPTEFASITLIAKLREWKCNKFFLATEDKSIVDIFKKNFGNKCIIHEQEYINYNPAKDKVISHYRIERENDHFLQGKDYLTQMMLLSMCNSFMGARCSGTTFAALAGENFEHTYFFNLGRYGMITLN